MKTKSILAWLGMVCCLALNSPVSEASLIVYKGDGAAAGLSATADFQLLNGGTRLHVDLVNTSTSPMPGWNQVLNSINFKLPVGISGGNANLMPGANVVKDNRGNWETTTFSGSLNNQFSFSNGGLNNRTAGAILSNVDTATVQTLKNAVTSGSGGGRNLQRFNGVLGGSGGLDFGLVAGNESFGRANFVHSRLSIDLYLNTAIANLDFLDNGSFVEFGHDYAFIGGSPAVPEPGSMMVWGVLLGGCWVTTRRRSNS